ncbi:MAG: DUF6442 family protein [Bacillota bacterium]|nr:DUF6442 family protein [Bacillota bacterium]
MSGHQKVFSDERSESVQHKGQSIGFTVMSFLLVADVMYRSWAMNQASWDLLGIVVIGGLVSAVYNMRQGILTQRHWRLKAITIVVAALIAAALVFWRFVR